MAGNDNFREAAEDHYSGLGHEERTLMEELYGSAKKAVDAYFEFLRGHTDLESPTDPLDEWFEKSKVLRQSILGV